jgi:hypothetical protein
MDIDPEVLKTKLSKNKDNGYEFQKRRHDQIKENYELYRDTVVINRLTQRQSVNVPLMKETVRTILTGIDDPRDTIFEELDNDKDKEIFINEYWKYFYERKKLKLKDIVDKKQVLLYGRSWWKLMISDGEPDAEVEDFMDMLIDRFVDPTDIDTAQYIIHQHIFRTLKEVANNEYYDKEAIARLKSEYATEAGLFKAGENMESLARRNDRMREMGVPDIDNPMVGETTVELNEHYVKLWDEQKKKFIIHVATTCSTEILAVRPLEEIMGETDDNYWQDHFPFVSWADDVERIDFYSDGWADVVRTPNKILNAHFSGMVENRTLRNFGMNFYDATMEGFVPQTFEPIPFGWYPIPVGKDKKIQDVVQRIDVPDLADNLEEMNFIKQMVETATAATATEKGQTENGEVTLGEIKMVDAKAQARISSMSIFYQEAQRQFGEKWYKMIEANADNLKAVTVYKKSYKGNWFKKELSPKDWKSAVGYRCKVVSSSEKEKENIQGIQKLAAAQQYFPGNIPFMKLFDKKMLDFIDATPEEVKEIMDFQEQQGQGGQQLPQNGMPPGASAPVPNIPQLTPQPNALAVA